MSGFIQHVGFFELVGRRTTRDLHLKLVGLRGAVGNRLGIASLEAFCLMVGDDDDGDHQQLDAVQLWKSHAT